MLERLRNQIGTAGLVVAIVALVAALGGGAYAATGGSDGAKATASAKQGKQGKQGKTGKTGPAGPAGPAGPQGPAGPKGDTGAPGANGAPGADGKSVSGEAIAAGGVCGAGVTGVKYTLNATPTNVCNGKKGDQGIEGEAGKPGPTCDEATGQCLLPPGATETGLWGFSAAPTPLPVATISYPLRLSSAPSEHFVANGSTAPAECPGSAAAPKAAPGNLCVYESAFAFNVEFFAFNGPNHVLDPTSGSQLSFLSLGEEVEEEGEGIPLPVKDDGSWAVTAPSAP